MFTHLRSFADSFPILYVLTRNQKIDPNSHTPFCPKKFETVITPSLKIAQFSSSSLIQFPVLYGIPNGLVNDIFYWTHNAKWYSMDLYGNLGEVTPSSFTKLCTSWSQNYVVTKEDGYIFAFDCNSTVYRFEFDSVFKAGKAKIRAEIPVANIGSMGAVCFDKTDTIWVVGGGSVLSYSVSGNSWSVLGQAVPEASVCVCFFCLAHQNSNLVFGVPLSASATLRPPVYKLKN